jgi:hypothetical protein
MILTLIGCEIGERISESYSLLGSGQPHWKKLFGRMLFVRNGLQPTYHRWLGIESSC